MLCFSCSSFMNLFLYQVVKLRCRCRWWPHATAGDIPCWQCVFFPLTYCFWILFSWLCVLFLYFLIWHIVFGYFFSWFGIDFFISWFDILFLDTFSWFGILLLLFLIWDNIKLPTSELATSWQSWGWQLYPLLRIANPSYNSLNLV